VEVGVGGGPMGCSIHDPLTAQTINSYGLAHQKRRELSWQSANFLPGAHPNSPLVAQLSSSSGEARIIDSVQQCRHGHMLS